MAKVLPDFTIKRRGRRGEEIDFDPYFDGKIHELKHGSDFKTKISTFRQKASRAARERGGSVETRVDPDKGVIQLCYSENNKSRKR